MTLKIRKASRDYKWLQLDIPTQHSSAFNPSCKLFAALVFG